MPFAHLAAFSEGDRVFVVLETVLLRSMNPHGNRDPDLWRIFAQKNYKTRILAANYPDNVMSNTAQLGAQTNETFQAAAIRQD